MGRKRSNAPHRPPQKRCDQPNYDAMAVSLVRRGLASPRILGPLSQRRAESIGLPGRDATKE